ncbi:MULTISPECIES: heme ABC transporter permease/ATP-binding protein CydD [unclassified Shewanella]|uniref:heme ABC transporter permease/ATP-binding protein CydD n=1 Tax=Shewanella TaxID=22 RepID=UPI0021D8DC91|nr:MULTISPECIES: cysteine/glutathione ABC transporter permease/ATP-binding protein CydD [unclassified Shewanella]MCU8020814.1 cysteine/glutathione ABC transporter permease/ATP-binding protein CydD [Shewanella sp. SM78]MCU8042306.1 cysteine/glutathione ABC transporter permease/ATP-binding protein CydD [Shewanella sp. SM68]MCU8046045.1 cysteine/glutathione ABC transporter permease/ATP-binding protein CydD [Shewanella sp. SM65]MCU8078123.1 cysteine/glutathione ABC transporter permease/ATP-binding 
MDKSLEKSLLVWLKAQKKACGLFLKLSLWLGMISAVAMVAQAYIIATILDGVIIGQVIQLTDNAQTISSSVNIDTYTPHFIALIALMLLRALLAYGRERASFEAGKRLRGHIRAAVMDKLTKLGPAFIKGKPAGSWASIVLEQVEDLQDFYARYLPQISLAGFIPVLILAVVFPINWAAGLILLLTAPLIPMFMILVGMGAADANRKNFSALARLSGHFMDRLKGLSTLKLFHRGDAELKVIATASEEFRSRTMSVLRMAFLSSAVLEFFAAVSIAVLAVYFGFSYLGHLDFGYYGAHANISSSTDPDMGGIPFSLFTGLFILILAPEFYQPLRDMGTHYHAKAQAIGAAEALITLLEHPEPEFVGHVRINSIETLSADNLEVFSVDGTRLLGPLSFELKEGERLALVGPSGAGKTSLLNALLGFLPYKGHLLINGHELSALDLAHWRQHLAWLGQEPQLFHGTVRDNVALADPTLPDDTLWHLLAEANISDFVKAQPLGLDAPVGEQSSGLSVGQAQRIALARALGQQASLFVLDEPTASLDSQSEQAVSSALNRAMAGKMCIMVTHRLDQLDQMDTILVLDKGLIVQRGDYTTLSDTNGLFQTLLRENVESVADIELVPLLASASETQLDSDAPLDSAAESTKGDAQ